MDSVFTQLGLVTVAAAAGGIVARLLRQPILLGYIAAGLLLGTGGLHLIENVNTTQDLADIGILFLLFLVGLELDFGKVKELGAVIITTGLVQIAAVQIIGYFLIQALGFGDGTAIYYGLAAAFSSTAVVLKRLSDNYELASLHGRITVGILLLQDIAAVIVLMVISGFGSGAGSDMIWSLLVKGSALLLGTWFLSRFVLGKLFFYLAKSAELLFLSSLAWAFAFAGIAALAGFSAEIGAFLAGLSLASLPYGLEIIGRVRPLKDFFLVIFFVVLGLEVSLPVIAHNAVLILALAFLVVFVKSFVTALTMVRLGYPKRPSYKTGVALGQMSEFSLLIALLGLQQGHIGQEAVSVIAAMIVISIVLNSYWYKFNHLIYPLLVQPLAWAGGRVHTKEGPPPPEMLRNHVLLFGANRAGTQLLHTLLGLHKKVLVVDHNPQIIKRLSAQGITTVYGDIDDLELLHDMGLDSADLIVSTVPNAPASLYLIEHTRHANKEATIITTAEQVDEALRMYEAGADYVILPRVVGGEQAARLLEAVKGGEGDLAAERSAHIASLRKHRAALTV